jgi:hypothetical protein
MKLLSLTLAALIATSPLAVGQKKPVTPKSESPPSKKVAREILKMESQLKQALAKCNTVLLERLLADYYADSYEGSGRAVGKKGTIQRCKDDSVPYYSIDEDLKLTVRADIVFVEGISKVKPNSGIQTDAGREADAGRDDSRNTREREEVRVKRLWTKKDGRWLLIAQSIEPAKES